MIQQNYRGSADDYSSKEDHSKIDAEGKSGGNAGAGQSGQEGLGKEKKTDDERFGSRKPAHSEPWKDEGKKDAPGRHDEPAKHQ